jgi:hypothetical protein
MADDQDYKNKPTKIYSLPNYEVLASVTKKIPAFCRVTPCWLKFGLLQRKLLPHILLIPPKRLRISTKLHHVT